MAKKGTHISNEHKAILRERMLSNKIWLGKTHKESTKLKISNKNKGKKFTEEHINKLSISHKGNVAWNKGKTGIYTEDSINKMKESRKQYLLKCPKTKKVKVIKKRKSRKNIPTGYIPVSAFKKGHLPWNFVDGRSTRVDLKNRYGADWRKIRKNVLFRDQYVCQKCGIDNVNFEVHHIISYLLTKDNSMDNLVTLCKKCHRKIEALEMKMKRCKGE